MTVIDPDVQRAVNSGYEHRDLRAEIAKLEQARAVNSGYEHRDLQVAFEEGFHFGVTGYFDAPCPYPPDTLRGATWHRGLTAGRAALQLAPGTVEGYVRPRSRLQRAAITVGVFSVLALLALTLGFSLGYFDPLRMFK